MKKEIILTGIRSNSIPHIGNYLGAFLPMVELQQRFAGQYQINMFVPDLHSFTTPIDHDTLYQNSIDNLKYFIAAGLDTNNPDTYIYRQSYIPAHSELTWILDCFAYFGELSRMIEFKEKIKQVSQKEEWGTIDNDSGSYSPNKSQAYAESKAEQSASVGLFNYPVLMAADILLYGARYIPVGEDQRQHIELTRNLAQRVNNKFAQPIFTVPEPWAKQLEFAHRDNGIRIRSLTNPDKKMSKSVDNPRGTILLTDSPQDAAKKVMGATTDSFGEIQFSLTERPGISNLLQILALMSGRPQSEVINEWAGKTNYGELKQVVAKAVQAFLQDFQAKLAQIDEPALLAKLEHDEEAMRQASSQTLYKVQQAVGLRPKAV